MIRFRKEYAAAERALRADRHDLGDPAPATTSPWRERFNVLPRVLPFVLLLTGVMVALYGGYATPSETAGLGGLLALVLIAADLRRLAARATSRRS